MKSKKAAPKVKKDKKRILAIATLVVGVIMLIVGVVALVLKLNQGEAVADEEYLVTKGEWSLEDAEGVIWRFTETGKGTLTTNNHLNDYDFTWSMADGKISIKTDWLYELDNEYTYEIDQGENTLKLQDDEGSYTFTAK